MLILFMNSGTTQKWAVLLMFGGNKASIFRNKVGGLCKWLIYIGRQCSRLRNVELDLACVNRNNEQGIVTMYSFSTSTGLL